jgi:hypothetical protein
MAVKMVEEEKERVEETIGPTRRYQTLSFCKRDFFSRYSCLFDFVGSKIRRNVSSDYYLSKVQ